MSHHGDPYLGIGFHKLTAAFGLISQGYAKLRLLVDSPQWGAADAEIKVPSGESTELKRSPFKA